MSTVNASMNPTIDGLVEATTVRLQLTEPQERLAEERADGVKSWLAAPGSPLARFAPRVFPQGSKRHGTTVRPKNQVEYDIDLVCLLQLAAGASITPHELFELVHLRLHAHPAYRSILSRMNRCSRLSYANDFHLDIIAARPDWVRGGTCLVVPDRRLCCWCPTNPAGFAEWFDLQAVQGTRVQRRYAHTLVTEPMRRQMKATLRRVVQLMKRRRDIVFDGDQYCARSIVLTTLAAMEYDGEALCTDALVAVLDAIIAAFGHLVMPPPVPNPTNPAENFAEKWTVETFADFIAFIRRFKQEMDELLALTDLPAIRRKLGQMVGEDVADIVVKELGEQMRRAKDQRVLRAAGPAVSLTTASAAHGLTIPGNTFHGDGL